MFTLHNIAIKHDGNEILNPISITMFESCCLNIHGPNGSGKTSLLKALVGLSEIKPNTILYDRKDVMKHQDEYRLMTEYIGHSAALNDNMTVLDNLSFWTDLYGTEMMLPAALYTMRLDGYVDAIVKDLSAGTKRRVSLTKLLLSDSPIWFLDEPFANLDQEFRDIMMNVMRARCEQKGIVVFTSHAPVTENFITNFDLNDYAV